MHHIMKHGVAKKRRRGLKVTRNAPKKHQLKVLNSVKALGIPEEIKSKWDKTLTPSENLSRLGLLSDPTQQLGGKGQGRKTKPGGQPAELAAFIGMSVVPESDILSTNHKRSDGKRKILTETEISYAQDLVKAHGQDFAGMALDIETNYKQLTHKKLEKLVQKYMLLKDSKE